jgi:hypothetical protein
MASTSSAACIKQQGINTNAHRCENPLWGVYLRADIGTIVLAKIQGYWSALTFSPKTLISDNINSVPLRIEEGV